MIRHDFPFLDTNDLNLDWLLKNMKLIIEQWADYQVEMNTNFANLNDAFDALKAFIETWFDELDVQEEINNKIDAMKESGDLAIILNPLVASETSTWLSQHISNPSNPPIDTSLTVRGAAADAKTVGDLAVHFYSAADILGSSKDINLLDKTGFYMLSAGVTDYENTPENGVGGQRIVICYKNANGTIAHQLYFNPAATPHVVAYRVYHSNSWHNWIYIPTRIDLNDLQSQITAINNREFIFRAWSDLETGETITSLNDERLYVGSGWTNIPADTEITDSSNPPSETHTGQRILITFLNTGKTTRHQIYINSAYGLIAYRLYRNNAWQVWYELAEKSVVDTILNREFMFRAIDTLISRDTDNQYDLNDSGLINKAGWFYIGAGETVKNGPKAETGQRFVQVYKSGGSVAMMFYENPATGTVAVRYFYNTWKDWTILIKEGQLNTAIDESFRLRTLTDPSLLEPTPETPITSYNDSRFLKKSGWTTIGASVVLTDAPEYNEDDTPKTGQRYIIVLKSGSALTHMLYYNNATRLFAFRAYFNNTWQAWFSVNIETLMNFDFAKASEMLAKIDNNTSLIFDRNSHNAITSTRTDIHLKVASYNVARYNNNSNVFLPNDKLFNFKKMLNDIDANIIATQEGVPYIDGTAQTSLDYLFAPLFNYEMGSGNYNNIFTKEPFTESSSVRFSGQALDAKYRVITYGILTINNKRILVCSTHPNWNDANSSAADGGGNSQANINIRLQQYTELFKWTSREIDAETGEPFTMLNRISNVLKAAPLHDYCIICMDGNTSTDTDKANIKTLATQYGYTLANGDYLGWIITQRGTKSPFEWHSLDNIIVSNNIAIDKIVSYTNLHTELYSDHVPMVAELTLLDA